MSKQIKIDTSIFNLDIVYDENMAKMVEYDIYDGKGNTVDTDFIPGKSYPTPLNAHQG